MTQVLFDRLKSNLAQCINDGTIYFVKDSNGNFTQIALGDGSKSHVVGIGPKMDDATKQELMSKLGLTPSANMDTIQLGKLANQNGVSSQKVVTYERTGLGTDTHEISTVGYVQQYLKTAKAMVYAGLFNAQTKEITDYNTAIISPSEEGNVTFDYLLNGNEGETLLTPGMSFIVGTAGNLEGYQGVSVYGGQTNVEVGDMIIIINVQPKEGDGGGSTYNEASILVIQNTNLNIADGAITTAKLADGAVTNEKLSTDIQSLISNLSKTATFAGIATPTTNPGTPEGHVFYIANGKGTYTNFGGIDVTEDEVVVLYYDTVWHKNATGIASNDKLTELEKILVDKVNRVNANLQITNLTQTYKIPSNFVSGKYIFEKNKEIKLYIESDGVISDGFTPYVRTGETLEPMCHPGQGKPNKIISYNPTIDVEYIHIYIPTECVIKNGTINISAQQTVSNGLNKDIENLMNDVTMIQNDVSIIQNDVTSVEKELVDINDTLYGNEGKEIDITDVLGMPIDGFWYNKNIGSTFTGVLDATDDGIHYEKIDTTDYASIKIVVENSYGNRAVILCDEKNIVLASYKWGDHTGDKTIVVDTTNGKWLYISTNNLAERGTLEVTAMKKPSKGLVGKVLYASVSKMYVAPNGNDKNEGSVDSPLATINKAIESGASCILLADGVYEQKINLQRVKGKDIKIMPAANGITPIIKSPNRLVINDGSEALVSGKAKTYQKVLGTTLSASLKWIYQEGVADETTRVDNAEIHPLQRGLAYRCENTCIILATSNTVNDAIAEIEAYDGYKWYFDGSTKTLYFSRPQHTSLQTSLVIPDESDKIFDNIPQGVKVDMSGISIWYMKGNFYNMFQPNVFDCSVKYVNDDGFSWDNTIGATFNHCEACRCQFYDNGDGFNAHATYTSGVNPYAKYTTATLIDCWAHDIYDDGYSDHERCEVQIHGGLFEYCGKGGLTPSYGTHCICYNVLSRRNYRGFYMAGVVAEEGGNGGQLMCYNCISENNYEPSVNENKHSPINGSEGSGFHCSGNVNSMILYNCVSIGNNIGYRTDSNAVARLIDCRTKDDTAAKNIGETSVVNNTNTL